jgi:drug/metabolite transporter (DMT)-like permease
MVADSSRVLPFHIILPLASAVVYVAAALFLKRASEAGAGVWRTTRMCNLVTAALFAPLWLLGGTLPSASLWWQPALVAMLFIAGQGLTMVSLRIGDVSVATPVMGVKIILVALLTTLLLSEQLTTELWLAAALSSAGIALLNFSRPAADSRVGTTIVTASLAAASYALFDVLVQKWAPVWGAGRFLPVMMGFAALYSVALRPPATEPHALSKKAALWRTCGAACLGLQALMLVSSIAIYRHAPVANVLYSSRGLWSVLVVWLAGHWLGGSESRHSPRVFAWRLAGAVLLTAAIAVVSIKSGFATAK